MDERTKAIDYAMRNHETKWLAVAWAYDAGAEVVRKDAESLRHIAALAHCGGLCGLSEADALVAIRRISLAA